MITYYLLARRRNEDKEYPSQADLCFITLATALAMSKPLLILFSPFLCFETKSDYIGQAGSQLLQYLFFCLSACECTCTCYTLVCVSIYLVLLNYYSSTYLVCMCDCVWVWAGHRAHVTIRGQFQESVFSSHHVRPDDRTRIIVRGSQCAFTEPPH